MKSTFGATLAAILGAATIIGVIVWLRNGYVAGAPPAANVATITAPTEIVLCVQSPLRNTGSPHAAKFKTKLPKHCWL
jgi:hypothetical protein